MLNQRNLRSLRMLLLQIRLCSQRVAIGRTHFGVELFVTAGERMLRGAAICPTPECTNLRVAAISNWRRAVRLPK